MTNPAPVAPSKKAVLHALSFAADVMELLEENEFRIQAFRKAERLLERWDGDWDTALHDGLKRVPGLGAQLASAVLAWQRTGHFAPLDEVATLVPPGVLELFAVRGLGPKKIRALWKNNIESLSDLIAACNAGRVATLKGFGANTQQKLLENATFVIANQDRRHMDVADAVFAKLRALLANIGEVCASGELRRGLETVGEVQAVVVAEANAVLAALNAHNATLKDGVVTATLEGMGVRVTTTNAETFGAALLVGTASEAQHTLLVTQAQERGLEWRNNTIFKNGVALSTPSEQDAFAALGLPNLPPEWREAEHVGLEANPNDLIEDAHLQGWLHVHTNWSDGSANVRDMALRVQTLGGKYIGICDHSQSAAYAGGLEPARVRTQWQEIESVNGTLDGVRVLRGIESDILSDGRLDYDDDLLAGFDFVVASVHSQFGLSQHEQTARIVAALQNPFTTILGHPTGRLLLRRQPYNLDVNAVMQAALEAGTVIEINANPYRLDIDWRVVLAWQQRGVKFAINSDAHNLAGLGDTRYGVRVARKGMLMRQQAVNTWSVEDFLAFAKNKRDA